MWEAQHLLKTIQEDVVGKDDQDSTSGESKRAWFNFMHVMAHAVPRDDKREWIILDSGSSTDLFCNAQYVNNIQQTSKVCKIDTNGGGISTNIEADVHEYRSVWFESKAMTNIMGLGNVVEKYRVTYDSDIEDAFHVHIAPNKVIKFEKNNSKLYVYKPKHLVENMCQSMGNGKVDAFRSVPQPVCT